ncbi:MAG TPA: hypothetical protein VHG11_04215, partial [Pseudorhizobium sp.]|nr:hypothetical protein [Pseudorhizobium sp.]
REKAMVRFLGGTAILLAIACEAANAASDMLPNVPSFRATGSGRCIIRLDTPGRLTASPNLRELSSIYGTPATATITTEGFGHSVYARPPATFSTAPLHADDDVTFATTYSGHGDTVIHPTDGHLSTRLNPGTTYISVHIRARKERGLFPPGGYRADVTLTCE